MVSCASLIALALCSRQRAEGRNVHIHVTSGSAAGTGNFLVIPPNRAQYGHSL